MTKVYNPNTNPPAYEHRPRYADWKAKKAEGDHFERRVLRYLKDEGYEVFKPKEHTYDLRLNIEVPFYGTLALTGEVKNDKLAEYSKKLALQTYDHGKPSGIHPKGPNPDLWFHGVGDELFIIKTSILQSLCVTYRTSWGADTVKMGNPESKASGILMPISVARNVKGGRWVKL